MQSLDSENFKILHKYKLYLNSVINMTENIPKSYSSIKNEIIHYVFKGLEKIKYISYAKREDINNSDKYELLTYLSVLDNLLEILLTKKWISAVTLEKTNLLLVEINKMTVSWLNINKEKKYDAGQII